MTGMIIHRGAGSSGYVLDGGHAVTDPTASSTRYFGCFDGFLASTTNGAAPIYIPKNGVIQSVFGVATVAGILGSSETSSFYVRLNNTTDHLITSSLTHTVLSNPFNSASLSITVAAGDYIEIKWVTPAWVTLPTQILTSTQVYIE